MKCEDAIELFSDLVCDSIEPPLAQSLQNHLSTCTDCRECLAAFQLVWTSLDDMPVVDPPQYFHENLMSRVNTAIDAAEAAEARTRFNWGTIFKPRTLAYAASIAALMLAGLGGLHATKAALDPIGSLIHMFKPAPVPSVVQLSTARAEWIPNEQGEGTLVVYLKAQPEVGGKPTSLNCVVNVPGELLMSNANTTTVANSESEASIRIPMKELPAQSSISVTLSPLAQSTAARSKTVPVTLMQAMPAPTQ